MDSRNEFIDKIKDIVSLAKDQENVIFTEQLEAYFPDMVDNEDRKALIINYLKEKNIGIDEKVNIEDVISEDEHKFLNMYLDELKEIAKVSEGEKSAYIMQAMAGDDNAKSILTNQYLDNVVEIAKLYAGQGVFLEDLIGEGNIALLTGIEMLGSLEDPKEADGFIAKMIMDSMQDMIASNMDEVESMDKMVAKVNKISQAAKDLSDLLKRKVTVDELCNESGFSKAAVYKALKLTANNIEEIEIPDDLK